MLSKIKKIIKKNPKLHVYFKKIYYTFCFSQIKEFIIGTKVREQEWAKKHIGGGDDWGTSSKNDWVKSYWDSITHPHRAFLVQAISQYNPDSILEIGCNCGPNLFLLSERFPDAKIYGLDINEPAIQYGKKQFQEMGITNVMLYCGKMDDSKKILDRKFDVIFSDAALIYICNDKIERVIQNLKDQAIKALVFVEWHDDGQLVYYNSDKSRAGQHHEGCIIRDYHYLLSKYFLNDQISFSKITENIWPDRNWEKYGYIIDVKIKF